MSEPTYKSNRSMHAVRRRRYHRHSLFLAVVLLLFSAVATVVAYDLFRLKHQPAKKPIGATYEQHIAGPRQFKSIYFQFSDTTDWQYAPNDSTATKLTFLSYVGGLPAHSLSVYVNKTPLQDDLATTRVLPVQIKNDNAFTVGEISDVCGKQYKATDPKWIRQIALSGTSLLCVPDSPQFSVVVGQVGADYNLSLKRSDGQFAQYIIIYRNLTIDPNPAPFVRIMKTFQAL